MSVKLSQRSATLQRSVALYARYGGQALLTVPRVKVSLASTFLSALCDAADFDSPRQVLKLAGLNLTGGRVARRSLPILVSRTADADCYLVTIVASSRWVPSMTPTRRVGAG